MERFLNFYSKYPWVAIIIVVHWIATAFVVIYARDINITQVMGLAFFSTVVFSFFGFRVPKG